MTLLNVLILTALVATIAALASGIVSMAHGGEFDRRHSYQFMFTRVGLQGLTLALLAAALLVSLL
jgi:hypothetical protein